MLGYRNTRFGSWALDLRKPVLVIRVCRKVRKVVLTGCFIWCGRCHIVGVS